SHKADKRKAFRPEQLLPTLKATPGLHSSRWRSSRCFRPLGREWLSHGKNCADLRKSKAGSFLAQPRENEDERRRARRAAPPSAPFPDNANLHGRWRFRTSTARFRITSVPSRVSRGCLRKDRAEPCPEIPRVVPCRRSRAPRRAE